MFEPDVWYYLSLQRKHPSKVEQYHNITGGRQRKTNKLLTNKQTKLTEVMYRATNKSVPQEIVDKLVKLVRTNFILTLFCYVWCDHVTCVKNNKRFDFVLTFFNKRNVCFVLPHNICTVLLCKMFDQCNKTSGWKVINTLSSFWEEYFVLLLNYFLRPVLLLVIEYNLNNVMVLVLEYKFLVLFPPLIITHEHTHYNTL